MASNVTDLLQHLRLHCQTLEELDRYVVRYGLSINHQDVVTRRNELVTKECITDAQTLRFLECCCNTLDELKHLIAQYGLDAQDPAVQIRHRVLQVRGFIRVHCNHV